ncbi:LytTR family DNA-binding domain-containing protein [Pseudophaeobacter sp.]|uniref:LytTR family DNA-binding domain-containing protein n=1 Tax=Pseudophaeobacter sp. TaxID=1971739 RepID=UPI00329871A1
MREIPVFGRLVLLWALVTVFAAAAGPFGTFEGLGFWGRLGYWAVITGLSILLTRLQLHLLRRAPQLLRFASQLPYGLCLAAIAHGMNVLIFPHWGGWPDFGFLALVTLSVVLMIEAAVFFGRLYLRPVNARPDSVSEDAAEAGSETLDPDPASDSQLLFQRRLPLDKRGTLIRLEAQDHYLLVVTDRGRESLLMRLGDAADELSEAGLRVHRSHWVTPEQVQRHRRQKGRDFLQMADGTEVPVSRSYKPAAQAAGLL